jgi:hypothetical protein
LAKQGLVVVLEDLVQLFLGSLLLTVAVCTSLLHRFQVLEQFSQ